MINYYANNQFFSDVVQKIYNCGLSPGNILQKKMNDRFAVARRGEGSRGNKYELRIRNAKKYSLLILSTRKQKNTPIFTEFVYVRQSLKMKLLAKLFRRNPQKSASAKTMMNICGYYECVEGIDCIVGRISADNLYSVKIYYKNNYISQCIQVSESNYREMFASLHILAQAGIKYDFVI